MIAAVLVVTLAAAYVTWTPSKSTLQTTPAEGSGPTAEEAATAAAAPSGPGDPIGSTPGGAPGTQRGNVGGPLPTVPSTRATTTTTTPSVPRVSTGDIAFVRDQRIWLTGADGTGTGPLTDGSRKLDSPSWGPDGRRLVAVESVGTDVTGKPVNRLVEVRLDGSVRAITGDGVYGAPTWAPNGAYIAFNRMASSTPLRYELWTVRPDGSGERRIADSVSWEASWSPDGSRLVVAVGGEDGNDDCLCTMKPDGSDRRRIPVAYNHGAPAWSPDGQRIALTYFDESGWRIVTVGLDGSDRRVVAKATANELDWSPDGATLVFIDESTGGLARVDHDGTDRRVLYGGPAHRLSWRRA